jgi:hypothetical protein
MGHAPNKSHVSVESLIVSIKRGIIDHVRMSHGAVTLGSAAHAILNWMDGLFWQKVTAGCETKDCF